MMKKLFGLFPAVWLAMVVFASHPAAAANAVTVVGTINGGGTSLMTPGAGAGGKRGSSFGNHAPLYFEGTAPRGGGWVEPKGGTDAGEHLWGGTRWAIGPLGTTLF